MKFKSYLCIMGTLLMLSCTSSSNKKDSKVRLITLDPGHFHAALVQKSMYDDIDPTVYVYAPDGPDVEEHLKKIEQYNNRSENPTHWKEQVYRGNDFLKKMLEEKKGNVVVLAGNNHNKTEYIKKSIDDGLNVLGDKPMAINEAEFKLLENSFAEAAQKKLLLYDIMTERYEITNILQKEFAHIPDVFGEFIKGSADTPAVEMESVHFFYKQVSGKALTRPAWFFDVSQQGEGMVDVGTHLVDLVQWECFPGQILDYKKDIKINHAYRWATDLNLQEFSIITKLNVFPDFLKNKVKGNILKVVSNGEIDYQLRGMYVKITAKWDYQAPEGSGDTHHSVLRGTKANLVIRQGKEQKFQPTLYIEPVNTNDSEYGKQLAEKLKTVQAKYPGVELKKVADGWEVVIPEKYRDGHEAHFAKVTEKFLEYLKKGDIPAWEVPDMIAKYYTTTHALEIAKEKP